jgi:hypothetical protein
MTGKLLISIAAILAGVLCALATPAHSAPTTLPKCFGVVTRLTPSSPWYLQCQNPCIGGGQGCTKQTAQPLGASYQSETCKCQGGSVNCCDVWYDPINGITAAGYCGEEGCPGTGECDGVEDAGGDTHAACQDPE